MIVTLGELRNLTRSTGFKDLAFESVKNAYQLEMDRALVKVASGTFSYDQAVNDCIKSLSKSGLRSIDYASGKSWQLDTAVRMSVRTGLSQLSGKITEANIESTGVDLVITSQHMGSRPEHAVWQNKVFCYKGKSKKYPDFVESTGYGTVTGLKGANCSHDFYPFWEGISVKPDDIKEPAPVMVDGKEYDYYQATQKQRKMERDIRATKREIEAQKAIGGDTSVLQAKLRKQSADYHKFSNDVGIRAKDNRLKVVGGSSDLSKTKVVKSKKNDMIIDNTKEKSIGVHTVGRIDKNIYKCITDDIKTDEVIITDERIQHVKDNHPNDFERYCEYMKEIVENPDYIIEANKPKTALILKEFNSGKELFKTVLRLTTSTDNPDYKNSIITFMKIDDKEWRRLIKNKKNLYKRE